MIFLTIVAFVSFSEIADASIIRYLFGHRIVSRQTQSSPIFGNIKDVSLNYLNATTTILSGSSSGTETIDDVVYNKYTTASSLDYCDSMSAVGLDGLGNSYPVTYGSQNNSIGTIDSDGDITYVDDGTVYFTATYKNMTRAFSCIFRTNTGATSYTFNNLDSSSLAYHIKDSLDAKLSGLSPGASTQKLFSSTNDSTHEYVRSTTNFLSSVDLTSIAAYTSSTGAQLKGILVTPDIVITANHAYPSTGSTFYFVTSTSTTVSRTTTGSYNVTGTDIQVHKLSSPLTYGITPAKVMATSTIGIYNGIDGTKLTNDAIAYGNLPVISVQQDRYLHITPVTLFSTDTFSVPIPNVSNEYYGWFRYPTGGDSGNPSFFVINDEVVALGVYYYASLPSNFSNNISGINERITQLGSVYQLTTVDLSGFATY